MTRRRSTSVPGGHTYVLMVPHVRDVLTLEHVEGLSRVAVQGDGGRRPVARFGSQQCDLTRGLVGGGKHDDFKPALPPDVVRLREGGKCDGSSSQHCHQAAASNAARVTCPVTDTAACRRRLKADPLSTGGFQTTSERVSFRPSLTLARHGAVAEPIRWFGGPGQKEEPWDIPWRYSSTESLI